MTEWNFLFAVFVFEEKNRRRMAYKKTGIIIILKDKTQYS